MDDPSESAWGLWHIYLLVLDAPAARQGRHVELVVDPLFAEQFVVAASTLPSAVAGGDGDGGGHGKTGAAGDDACSASARGRRRSGEGRAARATQQQPVPGPVLRAPRAFVGSPWELRALVTQLSEGVATTFAAAGRQLPPWRTASIALGRWFGVCISDLSVPLADSTPGEWSGFRTAVIRLATASSSRLDGQGAMTALPHGACRAVGAPCR